MFCDLRGYTAFTETAEPEEVLDFLREYHGALGPLVSQFLLGQRVNVALKGSVATEQVGALTLKGLTQPVVAYNVLLVAIQPALRVIEGGSPQTV